MKKIILMLFLTLALTLQVSAIEDTGDSAVRIQCNGDLVKKTRYNEVAGTIFTFTLKDGKLYGREGELISNVLITNEEIKGKLKYRNGLTWESTRFQINRYSGAFNYHTVFRTLNAVSEVINSGMCTKVENQQKF